MFYQYHMAKEYLDKDNWKPSVGMAPFRLLSQLARIFENKLRSDEDGQSAVIEKKLRQIIQEKKQAHGLKMG